MLTDGCYMRHQSRLDNLNLVEIHHASVLLTLNDEQIWKKVGRVAEA